MTAPLPGFAEFFQAVRGHAPAPWQARLAERVAAARRWPGEVVVPTGAGGLACLDVAVWCLALETERWGSERELPTRVWWVGDECAAGASEDSAGTVTWVGELARALADAAPESASPAVAVARRLRSLCADADAAPLEVVELGSGAACPMPSDPARPAVILCSLRMYGSRLLFRGHGAERPALDAAMAGTDSLALVTDVGAAARLAGLVAALGECFPDALPPLPGPRQAATVAAVADGERAGAAGDDGARMPEVMAGLLWEWVKTTTPPEGEAPVEPYFGGIAGGGWAFPWPGATPAHARGTLARNRLSPWIVWSRSARHRQRGRGAWRSALACPRRCAGRWPSRPNSRTSAWRMRGSSAGLWKGSRRRGPRTNRGDGRATGVTRRSPPGSWPGGWSGARNGGSRSSVISSFTWSRATAARPVPSRGRCGTARRQRCAPA